MDWSAVVFSVLRGPCVAIARVFPPQIRNSYSLRRVASNSDFLAKSDEKSMAVASDGLRFSELQTHPNLHSPVCVGSKRGRPSEGVQFWCVCTYMAGYEDAGVTGHIGTNTPKLVLPRWGRPRSGVR